jgi:hypothetical protein
MVYDFLTSKPLCFLHSESKQARSASVPAMSNKHPEIMLETRGIDPAYLSLRNSFPGRCTRDEEGKHPVATDQAHNDCCRSAAPFF